MQKRGYSLIKAFAIATAEDLLLTAEYADRADYFLFDKDIKFPVGKRCHVCNNVTSLVIPEFGGRYAAVFDYEGSRERHAGDTHGDHIIKVAPDFDGVVDEDDQPVRVSCC